MKVVILAAGLNNDLEFAKPKCLLPFEGTTILGHQIALLVELGVAVEDIAVVIGEVGEEWTQASHEEITAIHPHSIVNQKNDVEKNSGSLFLAKEHVGDSPVVVIDGDVVFEKKVLHHVLQQSGNVLVGRVAYSISERGGRFTTDVDGVVTQAGDQLMPETYPWYIYSGIARLSSQTLRDLLPLLKEQVDEDILNNIDMLLSKHTFTVFDFARPSTQRQQVAQELVGGSYAQLQTYTVVRKQADKKGKDKLVNEIKWLQSVPKNLQHRFTSITRHQIEEDSAWFEMQYYSHPCLRDLILDGRVNSDRVIAHVRAVMDFMVHEVYVRTTEENEGGWIWRKHIDRVNQRLLETKDEAPIFESWLMADELLINGKPYKNIPLLMKELCERPQLLDRLEPETLRMVHGDLHFQNILVSPENPSDFVLVDPRGELSGSDLYYDLGKLLHSCNGIYDIVHTDQFALLWNSGTEDATIEVDFSYTVDTDVLATYAEVREKLLDLLEEYELIAQDDDWKLKMFFAEAMHFSSLMPFHLAHDGFEERALAMYVTGVRLLNELFDAFSLWEISKEGKLVNVNTNKDYVDLLENNNL